MIIPFGFETKEISESELREIQERNLNGSLTDEDKWTIDALISWIAVNHVTK